MQLTDDAVGHPVLAVLEGTPCQFCADGRLTRACYKGNAAVVCDDCETPTAQVWKGPGVACI
ncbi:HVO_A0556 family zinc finger protein [Natrinema amylolyticum]|uniref:HVO_A0556 family zinc finger protein n=1 Tax=Natrinema amylolyticum TaxID=2878679 RepID=UPI001CF9504D|nr:HVO_A0556 family zinc finger protein [Natrinema amylolyticum]